MKKRQPDIDHQTDDETEKQLALKPFPDFYLGSFPETDDVVLIFFRYNRAEKCFNTLARHWKIKWNNQDGDEREGTAERAHN